MARLIAHFNAAQDDQTKGGWPDPGVLNERVGSAVRAAPRPQNCPHDCPCDDTKQRLSSQRQPTRLICEVEEREGFTRKNDDGREPDFRLANGLLQPLGHLTADVQVYEIHALT